MRLLPRSPFWHADRRVRSGHGSLPPARLTHVLPWLPALLRSFVRLLRRERPLRHSGFLSVSVSLSLNTEKLRSVTKGTSPGSHVARETPLMIRSASSSP